MMKGKILVVDDEAAICRLLNAILGMSGYEVITTKDYPSALAAISQNKIDVILTDILLGVQSGIDLLIKIKEKGVTAPVVMITGHPTIENAARSVRHGAFDYLVKPLERDRLLHIVEMAMRHKALLDREAELERSLVRQKRLYESIVEDQTEMICRFKPDGTLTFVNDAYARYFGKYKYELIGTNFMRMTPESEHGKIKEQLAAFTRSHPLIDVEHKVIRKDGQIRWQSWMNRAFFDEKDHLTEIQSVGRDITARKIAEESLKKSKAELEAVFQSIPEGIIMVDSELRVMQKNDPLGNICPVFALIGPGEYLKTFVEHNQPCSGECVNILNHTLKTRQSVREYHLECDAVSPPRRLVLNCIPMQDDDKQAVNVLLVIRDITRLADLEEKLRERETCGDLIGKNDKMQHIYTLIRQVADLDITVLITGESGTGKELVMEAIHRCGLRASHPLIRVNCAALPDHLIESELFGHVRGAFTGAVRDRVGRFQAAEGGTLFIDEIGDLPPHIQLALLRVLERKEYERVGDTRTIKGDVRIIAATNIDLEKRMREGMFREDFYYRLNIMNIHIPPLRDRTEDIPMLVTHFCNYFGGTLKRQFSGVSDEVMDIFMRYFWPGNVRELKHVLEHACILCPGGVIGREFLSAGILSGSQSSQAGKCTHADTIAPNKISQILTQTAGNKARAARVLGISRSTLYRKIKGHNLS
jgi:PAS domain S-box-containing protein